MKNKEQKLLTEVNELLNQIVLKLEAIGPVPTIDNDDYDFIIGKPVLDEDGEIDPYDSVVDAEVELSVIKDACQELVKGSGIRMLQKYYTSTC